MHCPKCSNEIPDSQSVCFVCGYKLKPSDLYGKGECDATQELLHIDQKHIGDTFELPLIQHAHSAQPTSQAHTKEAIAYEIPTSDQYEDRKRKRLIYLVSILSALLVIVLAIFFTLSFVNKGRIALNQDFFEDPQVIFALKEFDLDHNNYLSEAEIESIQSLNLNNKDIHSLKGLEYITSLRELDISNNALSSLDLSSFTQLEKLQAAHNNLETIDVSMLSALRYLDLSDNNLNTLDISHTTQLQYLDCTNNAIEELNLLNNPLLSTAHYDSQVIISLALDQRFIKNPVVLAALSKFDTNHNTVLEASELSAITQLELDAASSEGLEILARLKHLEELTITKSPSTSISFENLPALRRLAITKSESLEALDLSKVAALEYLDIRDNSALAQIDLSNQAKNLQELYLDPELDVSGGIFVKNTKDFPDATFRNLMFDTNINTNGDDMLSQSERSQISELKLVNKEIHNLSGINAFYNLASLDVSNNPLRSLLFGSLKQLKSLRATNCALESVNLHKLSALSQLDLSNNVIKELDVSSNHALRVLNVSNNKMDVLKLPSDSQLSIGSFNLFIDPTVKLEYAEHSEN